MADIYSKFTEQETTSTILDDNRLVNFAYDDTAFRENEVKGKGYYDYNAHNNIQDAPILPEAVQNGGFNETSGVFKRTFVNHYFGRISYNLNKAIQALKAALGSFRADYSENISEYSQYAGYAVGDVCYRLNNNTITFYRCKSKITAPAGAFNGAYWEKPEEELSHDRPAVGVPVMWFEKVPDWAIRFDDGNTYKWTDVPALNFQEFKDTLSGLEDFGATLTADGFRVAKFFDDDPNTDAEGFVPMFTGGSNTVKSGYAGNVYTAALQTHAHSAPALTFTLPATSISHTHTSATCTSSGNHYHLLKDTCDYSGGSNTWRTPIDTINKYSEGTATNSAGSHGHTGTTSSSGSEGHTHNVTVTGYTGGVKETTGGNPDSFQHCWIVRYR